MYDIYVCDLAVTQVCAVCDEWVITGHLLGTWMSMAVIVYASSVSFMIDDVLCETSLCCENVMAIE